MTKSDPTGLILESKSRQPNVLIPVLLSAIFGATVAILCDFASIAMTAVGLPLSVFIFATVLFVLCCIVIWKLRPALWRANIAKDLQNLLAQRETSISTLRSNESELNQRLEAYETELRRSYKYFRQLMTTFGMATFHCDKENRFEWMHNFSGDESTVIGRTVEDVLPEDAGFLLSLLMQDARSDQEIHAGQLEIEVDGEMRHFNVQVAPRYDRRGKVNGTICVSNDVTEKARWNDHLAKLTLEVNHRARNLLAIIVSMLGQTAKTASSIDVFKRKITDRVSSLAKSIELISKDSWTATSLTRLVKIQLQHVCPNFEDQVDISGPDLCLAPKAIQNVGLAIHELTTNAQNYGALSDGNGSVEVKWDVTKSSEGKNELRLTWIETSDSFVEQGDVQKGLGLKILQDIVAQELAGRSELSWTKTGLRFEMFIPENWFESTPLLRACEKLGQPAPATI